MKLPRTSVPRAVALSGLILVIAIIVVNIVNEVSSHDHHRFDHTTNLALGAVAGVGLILLMIGLIWAGVRLLRRATW